LKEFMKINQSQNVILIQILKSARTLIDINQIERLDYVLNVRS